MLPSAQKVRKHRPYVRVERQASSQDTPEPIHLGAEIRPHESLGDRVAQILYWIRRQKGGQHDGSHQRNRGCTDAEGRCGERQYRRARDAGERARCGPLRHGVRRVRRRAYSQIKKVQPHLVILCTRIDELDGFQLLTMLKLDPDTRRVPVLTYTTEGDGQDYDEAISQLADDEEALLPTRPELRMN